MSGTFRQKFPNLVTARTPACGEVPVFVKKRIALSLCYTDLFDDNIVVVHEHALLSPLVGRAGGAVTAHLARVQEVICAITRMVKELFTERPGFAAGLASPFRQV